MKGSDPGPRSATHGEERNRGNLDDQRLQQYFKSREDALAVLDEWHVAGPPQWSSPIPTVTERLDLTDRNRLVEQHMIIVQRIASKMMRLQQKSFIEKDDLLQEGYVEIIKTVNHHPESEVQNLPLAIGTRAKTAMLRYIRKETRNGITDVPEDLGQSFIFRFGLINPEPPEPALDPWQRALRGRFTQKTRMNR